MFKKILALFFFILSTFNTTFAEPVLTRGDVTAWIGENNYMYLRTADGVLKRLPATIVDLLSMDDENVYCLTDDRRIYAVRLNGSASSVISSNGMIDDQITMTGNQQWNLEDETLTAFDTEGKELIVIDQVVMAVSNDHNLYYVQRKENETYVLKTSSFNQPALSEGNNGYIDPIVNKPISMTISDSAVTMVDEEHRIQVYDLEKGSLITFAPKSEFTQTAVYTNGLLLLYTENDYIPYVLEQSQAIEIEVFSPENAMIAIVTQKPDMMQMLTTPAPTPSSEKIQTIVVTNPPPVVTDAPTEKEPEKTTTETQNEDSSIRLWNTGKKVKKMQQRLSDLGYSVGSIDGSFGNQTLFAVNLFQDIAGFTEHSYMTEKMLNRLYSNNAPVYDACYPLKKGDRGVLVKVMQEALSHAGYDPGKIDGIYGKNTVTAVQKYQADNHIQIAPLEIPGEYASRELLALLYDVIVIIPQPIYPSEPIVITSAPTMYPSESTPFPTSIPAKPTNSPSHNPDSTDEPASKTDL